MGLHTPRFPLLKDLGLSENEALIYEILLEKGPSKPSDLVEPSHLGRGNIYNVLQQLLDHELVTLRDQAKFQTYEAVDPSELRRLLIEKQEAIRRLEGVFQATLPQLTSTFNLSTSKPAIQMFEGLMGFEQALHDSLTTKGEILTYVDPRFISGPFATINARYVGLRAKTHIPKRIIFPDTPESKAFLIQTPLPYTESRIVPNLQGGFETAMELYDNKVTFHRLTPDKAISYIIEDGSVAALHRTQFECLWTIAKPLV